MNARKFIPLLLVAAALLAYHNSLSGPFILDDALSIPNNPSIRHLWPIWPVLSPPPKAGVGGRPIVNLTLAINYALGGTGVRGYHALNLAIHILATLTLFGILRRTLLQPQLRERFGDAATGLALTTALIWMLHPLQTEAVTYLSQRAESLMGLLYLLTLYAFVRAVESPKPTPWFALSIVACLLGMATKEVMVTAPLMVLLYDRTFVAGSFQAAWTRRWRLYAGLAATWLLLAYLLAGLHQRGVGYNLGISWPSYAVTECWAVVRYLRLALWPHPLVFDYAMDGIGGATVALCALILLALLAGTAIALKRSSPIGFLGAWFFVILAPTSSVVPIAGQPMAESRMYLPLAAVIVVAVAGIYLLGERLPTQRRQFGRSLRWNLAAVVALVLATLTLHRNLYYTSELAIWLDTVNKRPNNPRAHENLGVALERAGRLPEAIRQFEIALQINPDAIKANNNLGIALGEAGRLDEAVAHFRQVLEADPGFADAHCNLGFALVQLGRSQEAIDHFQQALRLDPDLPEAHDGLGAVLTLVGEPARAIEQCEAALRLQPNFAEAHFHLGLALIRLGRTEDALAQWEYALRLKPDYAEAHYNIGNALAQAGNFGEAIKHYELALRIRPDFTQAQDNLARARALQ